jgi:hypothetical protein
VDAKRPETGCPRGPSDSGGRLFRDSRGPYLRRVTTTTKGTVVGVREIDPCRRGSQTSPQPTSGGSKQDRRTRGFQVNERRPAERKRIHALFEEIQAAVRHGERARVEYLMRNSRSRRASDSAVIARPTQPIDE